MPRKVAYSGKAKREQLRQKRLNKRHVDQFSDEPEEQNENNNTPCEYLAHATVKITSNEEIQSKTREIVQINHQPGRDANWNRHTLQFFSETKEEMDKRKIEARQTIHRVPTAELEMAIENVYSEDMHFPIRPEWNNRMTKETLDENENKYFREYVDEILRNYETDDFSHFELNLETWRQLWRVIEKSDVLLVIADARFPCLMFPPSLYTYTKSLNKHIILALNKIDLVPPPIAAAWKHYFENLYPGLSVVLFNSYPAYNMKNSEKEGLQSRRRQKGKRSISIESSQRLLNACKELVGDKVDFSYWQRKINGEEVDECRCKESVFAIGCVGLPNVGKSSLLNALSGKKLVSVSKTPGHTKHFQTIFLTKNICLYDCPGLVFPSHVPKPLQILSGSFPVAHLSEPFTAIKFLAERIDLPGVLRIEPLDGEEEWNAYKICDAWAVKRGFMMQRYARPDTYRAANHILRLALDGHIRLQFCPPGYSETQEEWKNQHETIQFLEDSEDNFNDKLNMCTESSSSAGSDDETEDSKKRRSVSGRVFSIARNMEQIHRLMFCGNMI